MREATSVEPPPALDEVPILADVDEARPDARPVNPYVTITRSPLADGLGTFTRDELRAAHQELPFSGLDWSQVVELRRRTSEAITEEAAYQLRATGRPLTGDDRLLLGRATIRRVVGDHVRALHRDGAELWSPAQEQAYVTAVEDAVFGYGRLQPLLDLPDVENIEIHGCILSTPLFRSSAPPSRCLEVREELRRLVLLPAVVPREAFSAATTARPDFPLAPGVIEYQKPVDLTPDTVGEVKLDGIRRRDVREVDMVGPALVVPNLVGLNQEVTNEVPHWIGARHRLVGDVVLGHHPRGVDRVRELRHRYGQFTGVPYVDQDSGVLDTRSVRWQYVVGRFGPRANKINLRSLGVRVIPGEYPQAQEEREHRAQTSRPLCRVSPLLFVPVNGVGDGTRNDTCNKGDDSRGYPPEHPEHDPGLYGIPLRGGASRRLGCGTGERCGGRPGLALRDVVVPWPCAAM
jgi:hypothetical protein